MDETRQESSDGASPFPRTTPSVWEAVSTAQRDNGDKSQEALAKLCAIYATPIRAWLQRHDQGADIEDKAQGFILFLLERNRFENYHRREAKFRSFLLTCLKGFLRDERRKKNAGKRGGGEETIEFDDTIPSESPDIDRLLDRAVALEVHHRTLGRLEEKFRKAARLDRFHAFRPFVLGHDSGASYAELAKARGMTTGAVKKAVFDLRDDYCETFRDEVRQTVSRAALEEEMRYLLTLLADSEAMNL